MTDDADEKRMRLRYAGTCRICRTPLAARVEAVYERTTRTVRCVDCSPAVTEAPSVEPVESNEPQPTHAGRACRRPEQLDVGTPGASARREFERRRTKREDRIREKHRRLGGLILALSDDPQSTTAWDKGALGEERLGNRLNELATDTMRVLHDRRIPGSRSNIDHIAVTPSGVYVIDAKRYVGKRPTLQIEGGLLRPRVEKLKVGGRDQTKLVDGLLKQVAVVRAIVGDDVPVTGVLCFIEADWPLIGGGFTTRGVGVMRPKKLYRRLVGDGPHSPQVAGLHLALADGLPSA